MGYPRESLLGRIYAALDAAHADAVRSDPEVRAHLARYLRLIRELDARGYPESMRPRYTQREDARKVRAHLRYVWPSLGKENV